MKRKRDPLEPLSSGRAKVPYAWVLDEIASLDPTTRPMFGCTAVYARGKIVLILRERGGADDGVWLATTHEHHPSLRRELRSMRSITVFGDGETGWQVLPAEGDAFEEEVLRACALLRADDPRIGKVPKTKSRAKGLRGGEPGKRDERGELAKASAKSKAKPRAKGAR